MEGEPHAELLGFLDEKGEIVGQLTIYSPESHNGALVKLSDVEARENGEEPLQIVEGFRYEYELEPNSLRLREELGGGVIEARKNPRLAHCGTIVPKLNTGRLGLEALDGSGNVMGRAALEVRSRKLGYRTDYRLMLEDVTERCIGLIMDLRAPSSMRAAPDPGRTPETLHQRFAFLRGLIGSRSFKDALHRISTHPHQRWEPEEAVHDTRRYFKPNTKTQRQLARSSRRVALPSDHPLTSRLQSLPERIFIFKNVQTEDTPENRFVKFALQTFAGFLGKIRHKLDDTRSPSDARLRVSVDTMQGELEAILAQDIFRNVSDPDMLPLRSPVLQRKEGYREIYQAWLKFDVAARLVWRGGDDVYGAGQRNVAMLYEYWVFFKLLAVTTAIFKLEHPVAQELIEQTADGFGIKLKSGQHLAFEGVPLGAERPLRARFSYNRTFLGNATHSAQGSWTERMRPDYTLSLWPAEFTEAEAEEQELIVHLHFDAKYRIEKIEQLFGKDDAELNQIERERELNAEKQEQREDRYKRTDLLKMHAYRDAIRRTHGAYILYPGDDFRNWKGYHEILPGLGAFPLKPGKGEKELENFIREIVKHTCDRATARERHSYHTYHAHAAPPPYQIFKKMPERNRTSRARLAPPTETHVLVGCCRNNAHMEWILREGLFDLRVDASAGGSFKIGSEILAAEYLLLYIDDAETTSGLLRITSMGSQVFSKDALNQKGYPDEPSGDFYMVFDVERAPEFDGFYWDITKLIAQRGMFRQPLAMTLDAIMATAHNKLPT